MKNTKHRPGALHATCATCGPGDQILCMCCNQWLADLPIGFGVIKKERQEFERAVFAIFEKAECRESLLWRVLNDSIEFSADVSDVFAWGGADAETIGYQDLPLLVETWADLTHLDKLVWLPELYAARKRGERPQGAAYPSALDGWKLKELFDACGPVRTTGFGNPRSKKKPDRDLVLFLEKMAMLPDDEAMDLFEAIRIDRGKVLEEL